MKISFANMLQEMCERIPGGDVDVVTNALGCDKRIGRKYLTGGLGFGGPCFPRDNVAFAFLAEQLGLSPALAKTTDQVNRAIAGKIVANIRPKLQRGMTAAVLGLAYKPRSGVIEESQGVFLARALSDAGMRVLAFDPLANGDAARDELHGDALILDSIADCVREADIVLIANPDPVFENLTAEALLGDKSRLIVMDFWRLLQGKLSGDPRIEYIAGGRCADEKAATERLQALWANPI